MHRLETMAVLYYMKGIVTDHEEHEWHTWSEEEERAMHNASSNTAAQKDSALPPGFLRKP